MFLCVSLLNNQMFIHLIQKNRALYELILFTIWFLPKIYRFKDGGIEFAYILLWQIRTAQELDLQGKKKCVNIDARFDQLPGVLYSISAFGLLIFLH